MELRDSQYKSFHNQKLIALEQFAKLKQFQTKPIWKYNKLSKQIHNAYVIEEFEYNWNLLIQAKY